MLKKTSMLGVYSSLNSCQICSATQSQTASTSSTSPPSKRRRYCSSSATTRTRPFRSQQTQFRWPTTRCEFYGARQDMTQKRGYAREAPDFRDNMNWPCGKESSTSSSATMIPTPYEIFQLDKKARYSKHKYYELVKLYHPDKHGHYGQNDGGVTPRERLERYRLVVLAHEILSDPVKRRAYDVYGTGWGDSRTTPTSPKRSHGYRNTTTGKEYGYGAEHDSSVFGNATWEDWERWYRSQHRHSNHKQTYAGTYVNPNAFASFVVVAAVLSGVLQATRAGAYTGTLQEKAQAFTEETQQFMNARAVDLKEQTRFDKDERVKKFLERRDPAKYGLKDEEEPLYRKHFGGDLHLVSGSSGGSNSRGGKMELKK